jgi:hypothetical protein
MIWAVKADRRYGNLKVLMNVVTFDSALPHEKSSHFVPYIQHLGNYYPSMFFIRKQMKSIHNTL